MRSYTVDDVVQMNIVTSQALLLLNAVEKVDSYTEHSPCVDHEAFAIMDELITKAHESLGQWLSWKRNVREAQDETD